MAFLLVYTEIEASDKRHSLHTHTNRLINLSHSTRYISTHIVLVTYNGLNRKSSIFPASSFPFKKTHTPKKIQT